MTITQNSIDCSSSLCKAQHTVVAFDIKPNGADKDLVESVIRAAQQQSGVTLNPSGQRRDAGTINRTRYLGALAEVVFRNYLNDVLASDGVTVQKEAFTDYESHVDLRLQKGDATATIEVRGSFPFSNFKRVVCELFTIIGPYSTTYKMGETPKDFYLCALINEKEATFNPFADHRLYLAGGGDTALFKAKGKETSLKQSGAKYLGVQPLCEGYDVPKLLEIMRATFA